jgi:hypothetical protein
MRIIPTRVGGRIYESIRSLFYQVCMLMASLKSSTKLLFYAILFTSMSVNKSSLLERYEDPTGEFSNQSLELATWYAKHHLLLRKIVIIFLIVWSVATLGTSIFLLGRYFIFEYARDRANLQNLSFSYIAPGVFDRFDPTPLAFSPAQIFPGIVDHYDFFAEVNNANTEWLAIVTYRFSSSLGTTPTREAVVLPGQTRPITVFGFESVGAPSSVALEVVGTSWRRVDPHTIPDPISFIDQRISLAISDFVYTPPSQTQGLVVPSVRFSLTNTSLFDFWEFPCIVKFERAGQTVGISPIILSQFLGGEVRPISIGIFSFEGNIDSVVIEPLVNVFDPSVFLTR